jgi:hypothetical protein
MANEILCPYCSDLVSVTTSGACCGNGYDLEFNFPAMVANAKREMEYRLRVYPGLVAKGSIKQIQAEQLKARQAETIVILGFLSAHRDEFVTFMKHRDEFLRWLQSGRPEPFTVQEEVFR